MAERNYTARGLYEPSHLALAREARDRKLADLMNACSLRRSEDIVGALVDLETHDRAHREALVEAALRWTSGPMRKLYVEDGHVHVYERFQWSKVPLADVLKQIEEANRV